MSAQLQVTDISVSFGGIQALTEVSFEAEAGELLGVIGPNGAGKTTLLNAITGVLRPRAGEAIFCGQSLTGVKTSATVPLGLARTFQSAEHFRDFTALDFVMLGRLHNQRRSVAGYGFGLRAFRRQERAESGAAHATLERFGLGSVATSRLRSLPYGTQKLVDCARAFASDPKCVLLDEPTSGVGREDRAAIAEVLREFHRLGTTLIVIDHDVGFIRAVCQRLVVLAEGRKLAEGAADEVLSRKEVIDAYLGAQGIAG